MSFEHEVERYIAENRDAILSLIKKVVAKPSVNAQASAPNAPFGDGVRQALDVMLSAAEEMGLETSDCEGYFGFAQIKGEGEGYIAMLSHLDVVPAGKGWSADPFEMTQREGYIIGRGVCDNKGPSVLSLFALNFFKDRQIKFGIRSIFGCDEETGMTDMDRYNALYEPPLFAFTPDAEFPVSFGEKSVVGGEFVAELSEDSAITELMGADASNVIPATAVALLKTDKLLESTDNVTVEVEGDGVRITAHAKGGHSAYPFDTTNAIDFLADYIIDNGICFGKDLSAIKLIKTLASDFYGKSIGVNMEKPHFTPLTIVPTMMSVKDGKAVTTVNIRAPFGCAGEDIEQILKQFAEKSVQSYSTKEISYGLFSDPNSKPIRALTEVYNDCTGSEVKPVTINGGTYARKLDNCVSFGPATEEKMPDFVGDIHRENEGISIELLLFSLKVYILSLNRLQECFYDHSSST